MVRRLTDEDAARVARERKEVASLADARDRHARAADETAPGFPVPVGFVVKGHLMVRSLFAHITRSQPLAVDAAGRILLYRDGRYVADRTGIVAILTEVLGEDYTPKHLATFESFALGALHAAKLTIRDRSGTSLVNVANGMLDPLTGELVPHDPKYLSVVQLPVAWDPDSDLPHLRQVATRPPRSSRASRPSHRGPLPHPRHSPDHSSQGAVPQRADPIR